MAGAGGFEPPNAGTRILCLSHLTTPQRNNGWAGRIRTPVYMDQNHVSYRLTTAQRTGGEGGIRTLGELLTHIRLAGAHLKPTRSPLQNGGG